jgi:superfamily I DNA/RNA helicase
MATTLRLGRPTSPPRITLDEQQSQAAAHRGSPLLIMIESAVQRIESGLSPDRLLILAYGRERAAALRDEIVTRVGATVREPLARTFHSFSFSVLRQAAVRDGQRAPVLLSGAEQDLWIRNLLAGNHADEIKRWPGFLTPALGTDGFVRELRDLILRASERNLSPADLPNLALATNAPSGYPPRISTPNI